MKRKAKKKDLDFFNKFVSAFWAGDLDLTATFWNADFLSAGRAAQVAVGTQILQTGNFRGDRADDGIGQLHEFLVFRITPADVARKNPPDADSSQHKGITLDLDVLDPSVFPGTGTPEPGGISFEELRKAATLVCSKLRIVGCDVNELSPHYDQSGVSTIVACKIVREMLLAFQK